MALFIDRKFNFAILYLQIRRLFMGIVNGWMDRRVGWPGWLVWVNQWIESTFQSIRGREVFGARCFG